MFQGGFISDPNSNIWLITDSTNNNNNELNPRQYPITSMPIIITKEEGVVMAIKSTLFSTRIITTILITHLSILWEQGIINSTHKIIVQVYFINNITLGLYPLYMLLLLGV